MMVQDPIVAEVRAIREEIAAECDYDPHKIYLRGCEIARQWQGRVVTKEELLGHPASQEQTDRK